jgi:hypothetical protein
VPSCLTVRLRCWLLDQPLAVGCVDSMKNGLLGLRPANGLQKLTCGTESLQLVGSLQYVTLSGRLCNALYYSNYLCCQSKPGTHERWHQ